MSAHRDDVLRRCQQLRANGCGLPAGRPVLDRIEQWSQRTAAPVQRFRAPVQTEQEPERSLAEQVSTAILIVVTVLGSVVGAAFIFASESIQ